jgi:hypothetical protein
LINFSSFVNRNVAYGLLRKNPVERLSTTQLVSDPFVRPKVANFPQQYRPKYLEERIRRSHTKQLEQQIELITRLERRQSNAFQQGSLSRESSFSSRGPSSFVGFNSPLMNGHGGNNDSFVLQSTKTVSSNGSGNDDSPSNSGKAAATAASQQIVEHIQSLDILPTLLESLGSYSSSEKVTINHKSFIIDDENIINSLNAQQQQTLLEEGYDDDGEGGIRIPPSPIRQAKADINIVDGVFGNEKFITIDVKITPKSDDDDDENDGELGRNDSRGSIKGGNDGSGGSSLLRRSLLTTTGSEQEGGTVHGHGHGHGHVGHKSKRNSVPVLELHYTTEIKLTNPGESNEFLANPHHHFTTGAGHHHHNDLLTRRSLTGNGSKKYLQTVDDSSTTKNDTEGNVIADIKTRTNSLDAVNSRTSLSEAVDSPGTPARKQMAIVRQQSTSMINGKVLNNSVEEILTSLNAIDIDELQLSQFHRLTDTIDNVFHPHVVEEHHRRQSLLSNNRSNSNPLLPIAEVAFGNDGSGGDESFENDNDRLIATALTTSNKENNSDNVKEDVREKEETELSHVTIATAMESCSERTMANSSPSNSPFQGGNNRIRKSITEAIAQDHEFNSPSAVIELQET